MVVEHQFSPSWLHPNMGLLPGVSVPVFIESTGITRLNQEAYKHVIFCAGESTSSENGRTHINEHLPASRG